MDHKDLPISDRAQTLFAQERWRSNIKTDRLFVFLMVIQWIFAIAAALYTAPLTWAGDVSRIHVHVWSAIVVGGVLTVLVAYVVRTSPGSVMTRHLIAAAQVMFSSLLIQSTGGRIETHFHIFGSLAFLSFYHDWRILLTASALTVVDHVLRGVLWPMSIYGVLSDSPWRWLEHAGWVVFEDIFLIYSCWQSDHDGLNRAILLHASELESRRLSAIIATQHEIATSPLDLDATLNLVVNKVQELTAAAGAVVEMVEGEFMVYRAASGSAAASINIRLNKAQSLSGRCASEGVLMRCDDTEGDPRVDREACRRIGVGSMVVVPMREGQQVFGVLKILSPTAHAFHDRDVESLQLMAGLLGAAIAHAHQFEAKKEAERVAVDASRLKSEFLANMSHEIRTPMNGIIGMIALLSETRHTPEQSDYLVAAKSSADSLLVLISDILDFSKIEAGKLDFEAIDFDLRQVMSEVTSTMNFAAQRKGLTISLQLEPSLPQAVNGDPGRLRQVLNNLLANAVKFTAKGTINASVRSVHTGDAGVELRFEVTDTGIGLSQVARERLFQAFNQADSSTSRRFGGTGLGLAICKRLVEHMQGEIGVISDEGKGSTFWFTAKLALGSVRPAALATVVQLPSLPRRQARILVAEDNPINQKIILAMLQKLGHEAQAVVNGREALAALAANTYDLILMDCQMPEMDGFEATRLIRARALGNSAPIPIVALTANAMKGDRDICLAAGMSDYLAKPIEKDRLVAVLERWLAPTAGEEQRPGTTGRNASGA